MPDLNDDDRTASLMTPAKLAQLKVRPRQVTPAAYLDQLAADAGSGHVRRLVDLRQQLDAQVRERDWGSIAGAGRGLQDALAAIDFALVQPRGWLARATGKGKEAGAAFRAQVEEAARARDELVAQVRAVQSRQQSEPVIDRALLELEVEIRALEKIMDQGARWLQDMRNQLKARQAQDGDDTARRQVQEDTVRCELLVARLKQLRAASSGTQQVVERCRNVATRRASFTQSLQQLVDEALKAWTQAIAPVAQQAADSGSATDGVDAARQALAALQAALARLAQDASAVQAQQQALAGEVAALQAPLQAAA
jgi:chromosome segregation ATPase